jgi:hypothetical protein
VQAGLSAKDIVAVALNAIGIETPTASSTNLNTSR